MHYSQEKVGKSRDRKRQVKPFAINSMFRFRSEAKKIFIHEILRMRDAAREHEGRKILLDPGRLPRFRCTRVINIVIASMANSTKPWQIE